MWVSSTMPLLEVATQLKKLTCESQKEPLGKGGDQQPICLPRERELVLEKEWNERRNADT